jgi:hypothetical protein
VTDSAPASLLAAPSGDEQMTAEREELKYLLPRDRLDPLLHSLDQRIPQHRFTGEGANCLPNAQHFVTTIYFDTPSRRHFRGAVTNVAHNIKVRAKEYYDVHPSLAELATNPEQIVRFQPWVWIEMKRREGTRTMKRRFRLPKREVPTVFAGGQLSPDALLHEAELHVALSGVSELVDYTRSLGEPLHAACLVNYRRLSWQDPNASLRLTVDLGLSFFEPPSDLWSRERALVKSTLGRARAQEPKAVVEVKRRGPVPAWLSEALDRAEATPVSFSKFVAASGALS